MIVDYSFWRPRTTADLPGVEGVIRYLSHDARKAITSPEMAELHGWGIATALVFEDTAADAKNGGAAGYADGLFAAQQARLLGVPAGRPVYMALDWDIADYDPSSSSPVAKLGPVADYLRAAASELKGLGYDLGVYGGYWAISRAIDASLTRWAWQAFPWSPTPGGIPQQDPRVRLYQTSVQTLGGNADLDFAGARDWGQFRRYATWLTGPSA